MTIVNVIEDCNNPQKYLIVSSQGATSESVISTNVVVSTNNNRIELIEISKIQGDKGEQGAIGPQGLPGENGVIFDLLPVISGGTNNTSFSNNKIIYYDGTKLTSSTIDVNNIQTDIISNIYAGTGLSKDQNGQSVTINAALGDGLTLDAFNRITIDDTVITQYNFDLSDAYMNGKLGIPYGGTNNTFFSDNKFIYYDGEKLASFPLSTGSIVVSGQTVNIVAGSGLIGGGQLSIPNGSIVIGLQNSADILVTNDSIELSSIVNSGIYSKVTVDAKGRVTQGSQITLNDLISYLGFTPWYSGNDGSGSNLDADMLDGMHGSYYSDASNLTGTISNSLLPDIIAPGSAPKVTFNSKGLIIDSDILSYLDITTGLGYIPFDKAGGQILGDVELFGTLSAESGSFQSNDISIGSYDSSLDARGIRFKYGDYPQREAVLGYYPESATFKISSITQNGTLITEEKADTKYVGITGYQQISGVKDFLESITTYGRVIIRSKYNNLPPLDIGTNSQLVLYLNADYLDNQHGHYYRNAANLTGILYEYVIIPHLEDRSTVEYSEDGEGALEYIPKFHRPSPDHPIVLKDSLIYETGSVLYMDYASLSVGLNNINQGAFYSATIGVNNSGAGTAQNSLAVGENNIVAGINSIALNKNNIAMTENSIAMGTNAETWINNQIALGGFTHNNVGTNGQVSRDAHGQLSYIPLKYHGEADGWVNILNFDLPDNRTIEYSAELLFTKQKETGVASFAITTGIIKNYGYRDPARNYEAFKKTIPVVHHTVSELYNNSQERTYGLNIIGTSEIDQEINQSTLKITAPPLQYRPLSIESYYDPIVINPISDHQTRLKTVRGNVLAGGYRPQYVIKLSPFDGYPYHSGAKINYGRNIDNLTECLFYRTSGSPTGYIKFYNHGISDKCPLFFDNYIGSTNLGFSGLMRRDTNFNLRVVDSINTSTQIKCIEPPISGYVFRQYINKNVYGGISGSVTFNIYQVSGLINKNYSPYTPGGYQNALSSKYYQSLSCTFSVDNLNQSCKDFFNLDTYKQSITINKINTSNWDNHNLNIVGYINPIIGSLEFHISQPQPLSGSGIPIGTNPEYPYDTIYYYPDYYIDELSFTSTLYPYTFIKNIKDSFRVIDDSTISFHETQLGFVSGQDLVLSAYPNKIRDIINFEHSIHNTFLNLKINDIVHIDNTLTKITGSYTDSNYIDHYLLDYNFVTSGLYDISLASATSGVGFVDSRSFVSLTGTYSFDKTLNNTYTKTSSASYTLPLVETPCPNPLNLNPPPVGCFVPTGSNFSFILDGPYYDSTNYINDIITSIISSFKIATTSILISSNGSNNFVLPKTIIPKSTIVVDSGVIGNYQLLDPSGMDFKVNDVRIFDSYIPVFYSGYTGVISHLYNSYLLNSGNNISLHTAIDLNNGDYLSYKVFTENPSNKDPSIDSNLRSDKLFPSLGGESTKLIRASNWLCSNSQINGTIYVNNNQNFTFKMYTTGIALTSDGISNFTSNSHSTGSYTIATGSVIVIPDNLTAWTGAGLGLPTANCEIKVIENYQLSDYGDLLNTNSRQVGGSLSGRVCETILYDTVNLTITSAPSNTGIFSSTINIKKPYQTLNFNIDSYDELFRFMNNTNASSGIHNNFDVSFNLNNITSGIFHFDTLTNRIISNYPYSKIYNIGHGSSTSFSVAVESGYLPASITGTGVANFAHSKVYGMTPKSLISTRGKKTQGVFQFLNNDILKSQIYDIESIGSDNTADVQSIYLYDFAKNFSSTGTIATGILHHNHTAYNITDSKFSIWGRNFNGDTIIYPFRDLTAIIQDVPFTCATGYLCVKFSGVPNFVKQGDVFWIDIEPYIYPQSSTNIVCTGTGILNTNTLYVPDAINSGVVLGMNVLSDRINYNAGGAYITAINGSYLTITGTITTNITGDPISFNRETVSQQAVTNTLRGLLQNHLMGYYPIYRDSIEPGVASVLISIPPFYTNINHPYYNEWNSKQNTRGINTWRSSGNLGSLIMITGTENIQTDKDPNYGYQFLDVSPNISIVPAPTGYVTSGIPNILATGISINNRQNHYGFNNDLKKYLSDMSLSGIYKPCYASGIISASVQLSSASNWTVSETKTTGTPLIIRDIDRFRLLGIDSMFGAAQFSLTPSGNYFVDNGLSQDATIKFRIGINGGTSISNKSPDILVSGIDSNYSISSYYIVGLPPSGSGLSSYGYKIGPFSNTWFKEISISGLNNINKFGIQIRDPLGEDILSTEVINSNPRPPTPYIDNDTLVYYNTSLVSPWVMAFDLYNVSSGTPIGISGSSLSNTSIISSGITYTPELQKWQGYIVGHATSSNATYQVSFAVTGNFFGGVAYGNQNILFTGVNVPIVKFTNNPSIVKFENTGINPIVGYFNYQKPQPYTSPSPTLSAANNPTDTNVAFTKIPTDYEQVTSRELYSFTINNIGTTGYDLLISALENGITTNFTSKILSYDNMFISNVSVIDPVKSIGEPWQVSFDINGGGGAEYPPNVQLINTPSIYSFGSTFDSSRLVWRVQVTGDLDFLGRHVQNTGIYNIGIYARDLTGEARNIAIQAYSFPVDIRNIKPYYGIKEKDYFVNLDLTNPVDYYDSNYILPSINNFMPSTQTKIYDKYNYLLNINEIRYSGDKLTDKWNTRLGISNLNQEYNYSSNTQSNITVDVRGLDTDVISVMGLLKLKELDVVSTDYPPIQIIGLQPEEDRIKEFNQGDTWEISFGVIGGLSNPNFPPSIVLSGLPSLCSGYYPDIDPAGPSCLKTRTFSTPLQKWTFAFTGVSSCVTGQYNIGIKAFDLTGEDSANTAFTFIALSNPGPSIESLIDGSLYPNCQFSSGIIRYSSSKRGLPCPYATGISGINIIGNLPPGLQLVEITPLVQPAATGIGVLAITGMPTAFPPNNIYDSFSIQVVDKAGKKATTVITYNTAAISPMTRNPKGGILYFPNSGYYESYINQGGTRISRVNDGAQLIYDPYPSTGLFNCRSSLPINNCPTQITGTYQKLGSSGLNLFFGSTQVSQNNAFVVLNNDISGAYNGIYSIINISSQNYIYDSETLLYIPQYSGLLINLANTGSFESFTPTSGTFKYVTFEVVQRSLIGGIMLGAYPTPVVSCKTCILGGGYIDEGNKLGGIMKPSLIATMTGNYYPYTVYNGANEYLPQGPPNLNLISGLQITPINNTGIISEICFSNCYESGSIYLSGVIIPMPTIDITDPQSVTYNGQPVALATRCSFGSGSYRGSPINYRSVNIQYYIKDIINDRYYDPGSNSFSNSPVIGSIATSPAPTNVNSISFSAPSIATGTILQLYMYRNSDTFPTFDIHSYDYLENSTYWIHKASDDNDPVSSGTYPGMAPIRFGSGLFMPTGDLFTFNGQIIGGNPTGTLAPTVSGMLTIANTLTEVTGINNQPHNIGVSLGSKVGDGLWNISITGNIVGITGSYLDNYDLVVNTTENSGIPYAKSRNTSIPVTLIKPMTLDIPITETQSANEIYVSYGNRWYLNFNIIGGDRPPRYWSDINKWVTTYYPIIEIDGTICSYEKISLLYNQNNNEWSVSLRSKNIITNNSTINLTIKDATAYISREIDIVII
jgi:hypothetical protein